MAANNFFSYAAHGQPAYNAYTAQGAVAQPAAVAGVQASNAAAAAAAGYVAQQAAVVSAAPAATYRANSAQPAVVAYTAYQSPQVTASYGTAATYQTTSYPQYPSSLPAGTVHSYGKPSAAYYAAQPACVASPVNYTVSDPHYQSRPVYTTTPNVTLTPAAPAATPASGVRPAAASTAIAAAAAAAAAAVAARVPRPATYTYSTTYAVQSSPVYTYGAPVATQKAAVFTQANPALLTSGSALDGSNPTVSATVTAVYPPPQIANHWNKSAKPPGQNSTGVRPQKPRPPPKPMQIHYCEICKISCAGPQTYKEHLEGQKHKKKEAASKAQQNSSSGGHSGIGTGSHGNQARTGNALRCELCDVTCTGSDAYAAHIRGAKHQKVMKLHTKLGKPIPSMEPTILAETGEPISNSQDRKVAVVKVAAPVKKDLHRVHGDASGSHGGFVNEDQQEVAIPLLPDEKDVQPVGADYIEEMKSPDGKTISFNCKLCDCRFNDPNAKEMHMKGRRHRLQYKKKVNPDLVVDVKPNQRQKKIAEERAKRMSAREEFWRRREEEFRQMEEEERMFWQDRRIFEDEGGEAPPFGNHPSGPGPRPPMRGGGPHGPVFGPGFFAQAMMRRPETIDDRHVIAKHSEIYPGDEVLACIQKHVSHVEKSLKNVSDAITVGEKSGVNGTAEDKNSDKALRGVMRIGVLAKGLLLKGDSEIELVLLCAQHPTVDLLQKVVATLPGHLNDDESTTSGVKYEVTPKIADAAFLIVVHNALVPLQIEVTLTSPTMRDDSRPSPASTPNELNGEKCLEALAALRQVKWFQARAASLQSCVMIIRVLRELCSREPAWKPLKLFLLELVTERVLASAPVPLPPGDALRRVFEALSGGLLLPDSPGLLDPCEKKPRDVAQHLTSQERENLTSSAQVFLRLLAFRQIHEILQMDPLPQMRFSRGKIAGRKRGPSENGSGDENDPETTSKREKIDDE